MIGLKGLTGDCCKSKSTLTHISRSMGLLAKAPAGKVVKLLPYIHLIDREKREHGLSNALQCWQETLFEKLFFQCDLLSP